MSCLSFVYDTFIVQMRHTCENNFFQIKPIIFFHYIIMLLLLNRFVLKHGSSKLKRTEVNRQKCPNMETINTVRTGRNA